MKRRWFFYVLIFLAVLACTAPQADAQGWVSNLTYDNNVTGTLSGYSETWGYAYPTINCLQYDYIGDCVDYYEHDPWVSLDGYLFNPSGTLVSSGQDMEDFDAWVSYPTIPWPPAPGTWWDQGAHYFGFTDYQQQCYYDEIGDLLECTDWYYVGDGWNDPALPSFASQTVPQHLTTVSYSVSSFAAPGCVSVNANTGGQSFDFQYTFNNGPVQTQTGWSPGGQSCIAANQPQLFGSYQLIAAKNSADPIWTPVSNSWGVILLLNVYPPAPDFTLTASPGLQFVDSGGQTTFSVSISPVNGFASAVTLSANNLPPGATASFNPPSITPGQTSTMTLSVASGTQGLYTLTVTGVAGILTRSATAQARVVPAYNIVINAFIPWAWVNDGLICGPHPSLTIAHGDNRSWDPFGTGTYRVHQSITVSVRAWTC